MKQLQKQLIQKVESADKQFLEITEGSCLMRVLVLEKNHSNEICSNEIRIRQ